MSTSHSLLIIFSIICIIASLYLIFELQDAKTTHDRMIQEVVSAKNKVADLESQIQALTTERDSIRDVYDQLLLRVNTPTYSNPHPRYPNRNIDLANINRFIPDLLPLRGDYAVSQNYSIHHQAIDFATGQGNSVFASAAGVVIARYNDVYLGNVLMIDHLNSYKTLYAHLEECKANPKEFVQKGQEIGIVGNTGNSTHYHLHFQIYYQDEPIDTNTIMSIASSLYR